MSKRKRAKESQESVVVTRDWVIADILEAVPQARAVLESQGLPCHRCVVAPSESLAAGCAPLALDADAIAAEINRRGGSGDPQSKGKETVDGH